MDMQVWIGLWTIWLLTAGASAQVTAGDKAAAEALFDRGLALLREGKLEEACARLEQSQAIERGIGTMLYLAECYEKTGRTASAWALCREAASEAQAAGQIERAAAGRQRAERIEPSLSRLTIEIPEASRLEGLELSRNGASISKGVWGLPLPVDPGEQRIEARATGYLPHTQTVTVEKGPSSVRISIPPLSPAPVAATPAPSPMQTAPVQGMPAETAPLESPPASEGKWLNTQRLIGMIAGGAGVVLLGVGIGYGVKAKNKNDEALDAGGCNEDTNLCTSNDGVSLTDDAIKASKVANFGIFGGAALVAGGLVTFLLAPKTESRTKVAFSADPRGAVLHIGGVF